MAATKALATHDRHAGTLKKTIDVINTLTSNACSSTVAVYSADLETNWTLYTEAYDAHEQAIASKDNGLLEKMVKEYETLHTSYIKARIHIGKLMASSSDANMSLLNQTTVSTENVPKMAKLPACKLPTFDGNQAKWMEFRATCKTMLTSQVNEVQRLQCLKEALQGEPREVVAHVMPGEGSFEKAMFLLKNRYESTRATVNESLQRFFAIPRNEPKRESIETTRQIVNTVRSVVASLTQCNIDVSTWDAILIFYTSQLLHPDAIKAWEEKLDGTRVVPALDKYLNFLDTRLLVLETSRMFVAQHANSTATKPSNPAKPIQTKPIHGQWNAQKAQIHFTLKADYKCVICKKNHIASRCTDLNRMTIQERKSVIKNNSLCINCFQSHLVDACPFEPACKKCGGLHHTLLHDDGGPRVHLTKEAKQEVFDELEDAQIEIDAASTLADWCSKHFYHFNTKSDTILATALVPVFLNGQVIMLRALIDQGGTTNLISERACQMLQLSHTQIAVSMFGVNSSPLGCADKFTSFTIGSHHDKDWFSFISALVVEKVGELPLIDPHKRDAWRHLGGLPLANPDFMSTLQVDLLLGASVYGKIVLDNVIKGKPGQPVAQQTKLGWIIFGETETNSEESNNVVEPHLKPEAFLTQRETSSREAIAHKLSFGRCQAHIKRLKRNLPSITNIKRAFSSTIKKLSGSLRWLKQQAAGTNISMLDVWAVD